MTKRESPLGGTGKVFRFTLTQILKSKSTKIQMLVLVLLAILAVPVMTLVMGGSAAVETDNTVSAVYVANETAYTWQVSDLYDEALSGTRFAEASADREPAADEVVARLYRDDAGYHLELRLAEESTVSDAAQGKVTALLSAAFEQARYAALGATADQLAVLSADGYAVTDTVEEFLTAEDVDMGSRFLAQYGYAILVLMLNMMTIIYIVRAVVEEKSSKLVDTLMVSVKPLALISGKILAMMAFGFGLLLLLVLGAVGSYAVCGRFLDVSVLGASMEAAGVSLSQLRLTPLTVVVIVVSLLLAYLTFSIISGIAGACCSTMEDLEAANMAVVLTIMAGYMVSCFLVGFDNTGIVLFGSLCPIASVFCAPVNYILGNIGFGVMCLSWLIQAAVVVLLAVFCARVYRDLLVYRGSRLKLGQLVKMARGKGAA